MSADGPLPPADNSWVAAIHKSQSDFEPLGAGVVIDDRRVLTAAVGRTVGVTAPTGPVRGYFCSRSWPPKPAAHGRRRPGVEPRMAYALVSGVWLVRRRAVCKTVGSAYVGSNPTPATTCENGPLARNSRLCGPFLLCPVVCHLVALRAAVSRCPRTHSGRDSCPITVGAHRRLFHGRPRTGRAGGVFPA